MKNKLFILDTTKLKDPVTGPALYTEQQWAPIEFTVKTLSAYAVDHAFLIHNGLVDHIDGKKKEIFGDTLIIHDNNDCAIIDNKDSISLQIHYHAIRSYVDLFPDIKKQDAKQAERLALFYQEAEVCFDGGAWLGFVLLSGAIFEHMLHYITQSQKTLSKLSQEALKSGKINQQQFDIIDRVRGLRNLVHANHISRSYISRSDALDTKTLIDQLILSL